MRQAPEHVQIRILTEVYRAKHFFRLGTHVCTLKWPFSCSSIPIDKKKTRMHDQTHQSTWLCVHMRPPEGFCSTAKTDGLDRIQSGACVPNGSFMRRPSPQRTHAQTCARSCLTLCMCPVGPYEAMWIEKHVTYAQGGVTVGPEHTLPQICGIAV